ncbi:hypothetical protein [Streptomyces sp. NPDC058092]|uniref:hypothetical protein n=1 Tax=Streptomyces sp. NPDC058092 TaxID=3346336 RepID=UPI0036E86F34
MALAVRDDHTGRSGDGLGQLDGCTAEVETYFLSADLDVLNGQPVDRRWPLCAEEKEQSCEAVFGFESAVVQEPACGVPSGTHGELRIPAGATASNTEVGIWQVGPQLAPPRS